MIAGNPSPRKFLNRAFITICAGLFVALLLAMAANPRGVSGQKLPQPRHDVDDVLSKYDRLILNPSDALKQVRQNGRLNFSTSEGKFDLQVEPFDIRSDNYRAVAVDANGVARDLPRTPSRAFRGKLAGSSGTYVRLVLDDSLLEGIIITPSETFFLEPRRNFNPAGDPNEVVFYAESNIKAQSFGECGTMAERVQASTTSLKTDPSQASATITTDDAFAPKAVADVATEADFEFTSAHSSESATNDDITNILTMVNGIYDAQLGINLHVSFQRAWTANNDPYTLTAPQGALEQFASTYEASFAPGSIPVRDLTHLFTGKDLDGSVIGIAYTGTVCDGFDDAYGISQSNFNGLGNMALRTGLTAHEMGHNFGATHTGPSSNPNDPPQQIAGCDQAGTALMQPSISSNATGFCQFSIDQITDRTVRFSSCLTRSAGGCTYSLTSSTAQFPTAGGGGSFNVVAGGGCAWAVAEGLPWVTITSGTSGTGNGVVNFTVGANDGGPRSGTMDIAGQKFTVIQAASNNCGATAISPGQTINASLATGDCLSGQADRPTAFADLYTFNGMAGEQVRIELSDASGAQPPSLDTYLYLFAPDNTLVAENDDIVLGSQTNSSIPPPVNQQKGFFTLPQTGRYTIEATSYDNNKAGPYALTLTAVPLLLTETGSGNVVAVLDSVTFVRSQTSAHTLDALHVFDPNNLSSDKIARVILFTSDLGLSQQQNPPANVLSVTAGGQNLAVENVGPFSFLGLNGSYVIVALKQSNGNALTGVPGNFAVTVTCRGNVSNSATITISP